MVKKFILSTLLVIPLISTANTSSSVLSTAGLDAIVPAQEILKDTSKSSSVETLVENLNSSAITFNKDKIQWLLSKDGYHLNDLDNIQSDVKETRPMASYVLKNPISISTGCGTVTGNIDETLTLMLAAFKQKLKMLPRDYMKKVLGLPDINNPKEVFEFIYDTTTTMVCAGEAGVVQGMESVTWASVAYFKDEFDMKFDESKETSVSTQVGHGCPTQARDDENTEVKLSGTNKKGNESAEGGITEKGARGHNAKFNDCKQAYETYKTYIQGKVDRLSVYKEQAKQAKNTSCSVLANKSGISEDFPLPNPFAKSSEADDDQILTADSKFSKLNINFSENGIKSEILVNKEAVVDEVSPEGTLKKYSDLNNKISDSVFRVGRSYLNTLTECLNQYTSNDKADGMEIKEVPAICAKIDSPNSPYPVQLYNDKRAGFFPLMETKKLICDTTLFNVDDDQFIADSIGYVTHLLGQDKPTIIDLRAATETMVLNDFCSTKYNEEIRQLSRSVDEKVRDKWLEIEDEVRGAITKMQSWQSREIFTLPTANYEGEQVVKICQKSSKQKEYFVATVPANQEITDDTTANIKKIEVSDTAQLALAVNSHVDAFLTYPFDNEMLCKPNSGVGLGKAADTCEVKHLTCGINYDKETDRTDNLYENQVDPNGKSALENYKISLKGEVFTNNKHQKELNTQLQAQVDKVLKLLTVKERMDKNILKNVSIEQLRKITNLE